MDSEESETEAATYTSTSELEAEVRVEATVQHGDRCLACLLIQVCGRGDVS